jgi:hypothetical protein
MVRLLRLVKKVGQPVLFCTQALSLDSPWFVDGLQRVNRQSAESDHPVLAYHSIQAKVKVV